MPTIRYAHICEYARADPSGTVSIIGIFDTIYAQRLPTHFPFLHVIASLGGQRGETFQFSTRIAGPEGSVVQSVHPVMVRLENENATVNQINGYIGLVFPDHGEYTAEILFDGVVVHSIPFKVIYRTPNS